MTTRPSGVRNGSTRRRFLGRAISAGAALGCLGPDQLLADLDDEWDRGGTWIENLEFQAEPDEPMHSQLHSGLDGRLYTDLSKVSRERLLTPTKEFYVRTSEPDGRDKPGQGIVSIGGLVSRTGELAVAELRSRSETLGAHVMECAGNSRWFRFGLMSSAQWSGVALDEIISAARPRPGSSSVLVSGLDRHSRPSTNSVAGCSWIFTLAELEKAGAFLATHMNGRPLTPVHGSPVRLMVPGWYGCCAIKWVDRIELVDDGRPATSQMSEFALRTHQGEIKKMAAEYRPATVDRAAMPIRVEAWRVVDRLSYRVIGLDWGGDRSQGRLKIRFRPQDPFVPVTHQPTAGVGTDWALWQHRWEPPGPGRYLIQLEVDPAGIRTLRLDAGFYARGIEVSTQ